MRGFPGFCLSVLLALSLPLAAAPLRLVADPWPPLADSSLPRGGVARDIVATALERAGYSLTFQEVPWARAMQGLEQGNYDVIVTAWLASNRGGIGQYSASYLANRIGLIKRKDYAFDYHGPESLAGHSIAVVRGYSYSTRFDERQDLRKIPVRDFSVALQMVAAGRVDFTLDEANVARYRLGQESADVRGALELIPEDVGENSLHILVSLKHPNHARIVEDFNNALAAMKADGSYQALLARHGL